VVVAPPLASVTATVQAELSRLAIGPVEDGVEVSNLGAVTAGGELRTHLVGVERAIDIAARGGPAESLAVRVPPWAERAEIDVEMPVEQWERFTDFGLTVFDSSGAPVEATPLDYALARQRWTVPAELRGRLVTVELFPAYAWSDRTPPWRARLRIRFLAEQPHVVEAGREIVVVPGGRVRVALAAPERLPAPSGFVPLLEITADGAARRHSSGGP
jgi:hypothetical protein